MKKIKPFLIKKELGYILNSDKGKIEADLRCLVIEDGYYEVLEDYNQDNDIIKELNDKIYNLEKEIKKPDCIQCEEKKKLERLEKLYYKVNDKKYNLEQDIKKLKQDIKKLEQYILKNLNNIY